MKKLGTCCLLATMTLLMFSCTKDFNDTKDGIDNLSSETLTSAESRSGNSSTVVILENPDGPPMGPFIEIPETSSKLHRNANGITVNFKTFETP